MRLNVGFSFPPMSTSIRPVMQGIVAFAQSSSHRTTRQRHREIVAVWQPERNPADTKDCGISRLSTRLPVAPQGQGVLALPGVAATSLGVVVAVTLVHTTGLLASGGETTRLAVLERISLAKFPNFRWT